jgi:hypothetical protein
MSIKVINPFYQQKQKWGENITLDINSQQEIASVEEF